MEPQLAQAVVAGIAAVGFVVWLFAIRAMLRATRDRHERAQLAAERFEIERDAAEGTIVGEAEVIGQPEELSQKLAGSLAREGFGAVGPVKILTCNSRELVFEPAGQTPGGPASGGFRRGQIRLTPSGSTTRIEYAIETSPFSLLLNLGWLFVALGLIALIVGVWVQIHYVIASPNPSVRNQSVQMAQVVHFLWPPFLFAHQSGMVARMVHARFDSMVHNLPYV